MFRSKLALAAVAGALAIAPMASGANIIFNDFSSTAGLTLNGNTATVSNVLRLVPANFAQSGSAFSSTQINANSFSTYFQFRITNIVNSGADGLVFVIQPVSSSIGGGGGGEGYQGITPSVGIEFDTFPNAWDPNGNHIGVLTNGSVSTYVAGPVTPSTSMENGNVWSVWIDYNGTTLEVRVADNSTVRPSSPILATNINIASIIGQNTAYVGFTAGTGADAENHDILSWRYNDTFSPIGGGAVGTPALSDWALILLAGILAAIGAYKMRPAGRPAA